MNQVEVTVTSQGRQYGPWPIPHAVDPQQLLAHHGWPDAVPVRAERVANSIRVTWQAASERQPPLALTSLPASNQTAARPGEALTRQRVAAYAVVKAVWQGCDQLLVTQLSERVSGVPAGMWTLPGGGIDAGEEPTAAVLREVWEETGQRLTQLRLVQLLTDRRIARAPNGRVEDFHALRLIYLAACPRPTEPVVHDVEGSTALAAWMEPTLVAKLPATAGLTGSRSWWSAPDSAHC